MSLKQNWTTEEDSYLKKLISKAGKTDWSEIASILNAQFPTKTRTAKQCRGRFSNYSKFLQFDLELSKWRDEDLDILIQEFKKYGSSWTRIAQSLPGKSENSIKNKFYGTLRKVVRKMNTPVASHCKKTKKTMKLQSLIRIIEAADGFQKLQNSLKEECMYLREKVLSMIIGVEDQYDQNQISELVKRINQFNLKTRSFRARKLKAHEEFREKDELSQSKSEVITPEQTVFVNEETQNQALNYQLEARTLDGLISAEMSIIDKEKGQQVANDAPVERKQKHKVTYEGSLKLLESPSFVSQDDFYSVFSQQYAVLGDWDLFY